MNRLVPTVIDLLLVLVFAAVGRASHAEGVTLLGELDTAWPFLVACGFAWVALGLLHDDGRGARAALIVWLVTLVGGMGLRILVGGSAAGPFILVAATFLGAAFGGWRLIWWLLGRRGAQKVS